MDLIAILVTLLVLCLIGFVAHYLITSFFPEPMRMVALAVVGIILLLILLGIFTGSINLPVVRVTK